MIRPLILRSAIGKTPQVMPIWKGSARSDRITFDLVEFDPLPPAFRLMIRNLEFDLTEMPVVTLAQAKERGVPITGLPLPVSRRFHHGSLLCLDDSSIRSPQDLPGRRIAVRSFPQTTGVWVRGLLGREYGLAPEQTRWMVQEGAHVLDYQEPDHVSRLPKDKSLIAMLRSGEVDAITGYKGSLEGLRPVIADAEAASAAWFERTGVFPVNHVIAVRTELLEAAPWLASELRAIFTQARDISWQDGSLAAGLPDALRSPRFHDQAVAGDAASMQMLLDFAHQQKLFRRKWLVEELFAECPMSEMAAGQPRG